MLAIQIERRFTKPQIFTLYANQIFLGHGVYGFEAGAQFYFSKHAKDLALEEAALLAGLPKAPNYYSPINYPERALRRRNLVHQRHDGGRPHHGRSRRSAAKSHADTPQPAERPQLRRSVFCRRGAALPGEEVRHRRGP